MSADTDQWGGYTDIRSDTWIERWAPRRVRPFLKLARLDRPIGTWLLLFPGWWSIALAANPEDGWSPDLRLFILFAIGALVMRGAGCTVNDILDRDIDRKVERTRSRPIASGEVSVREALAFLFFQLMCGFSVLIQLSPLAIILGIASLLLVFTYPLMKRITWWPQAFLGLTFNWGALVGWAAVTNELGWPAVVLYVGCLFWTIGYDTIYAHQDKEDDARVGVKSTALLFGDHARGVVSGFYVAAAACFAVVGWLDGLQSSFFVAWLLVIGHLLWQVSHWLPEDQEDSLAKFRSNRIVGWLMLVAIILGTVPIF